MNFKIDSTITLKEFILSSQAQYFHKIIPNYKIRKIITDTRTYDTKGGIFFAIEGKNYDGHKYIDKIIKRIDFVVLSNKKYINKQYLNKFIYVKNTINALCNLALIHRSKNINLRMISVVGSNGKTTTKELIFHLLSGKYKTVATIKNYNNLIGTAYTLFNIKKDTDYCITELGISQPGEMSVLSGITKPDCVSFTNIGKEHLEFLGNLDKVFNEETKVLKNVKKNAIIIINKDDNYLNKLKTEYKDIFYSVYNPSSDICAKNIVCTSKGSNFDIVINDKKRKSIKIESKLLGIHNVYNLLCAFSTAYYNGVYNIKYLAKKIKSFKPIQMRGSIYRYKGNIILDESYNANPDSMKQTVVDFQKIFRKNKKILVLGDMLELGKHSAIEHKKVSDYITLSGKDYLFLVGKNMVHAFTEIKKRFKDNCFYFKDIKHIDNLYYSIKKILENDNNYAVLFKASRGVGFDKIIDKIITRNN